MTRAAATCVLVTAAIYALSLAWLPDGGHWIVDNGNKLIQVESLLASGHRDYSIPWPGRIYDPEFEFNPMPNHFSIVEEGRLYSVFSPAFPALASLCCAGLGGPGLYLLPLGSGIALLFGLLSLTKAAGLRSESAPTAVLIAGLCTPLWFYSLVFWEHILAASLAVWAVAGWLGFLETRNARALFVSAIACAASIWFRDQLLLLAALMGLLAFAEARGQRWRSALVFGSGLAAGLLPLGALQWFALGDPIGFHLTHGFHVGADGGFAARLAGHLRDRLDVLFQLFLAWAGDRPFSALLSLPLVALLLLRPALSRRAFATFALAASLWGLTGALATGVGLASAHSPIDWLLRSNGFWSAAPLLVLGLVRCRDIEDASPEWRGRRRLWQLIAAYSVLYVLLSPLRNAAGIHWGNRYLLVLYPLLSVLCAANLVDAWRLLPRAGFAPAGRLLPRAALASVALLLVASFGLQLQALDLLARKRSFTQRLALAVRERPEEVVITDMWWLPQTLASEFLARKIFFVGNEDQMRRLMAKLSGSGERRFLFITDALDRPLEPGAILVGDEGLEFFSQQLVPRRVTGGG